MRDLAARRAAVPGFALPRDAGRRPALQSPRFFVVGDPRSRGASRSGAGFRAPARCRSETGAPLFRGWRYAISLRVAQRCRVSRSRAMPVGDRRSACSWLAIRDLAARRAAVPGFALPRDAGRRPALRFFVVGDPRSRGAARSGAGFRAPARCRSETGAPRPALVRGWRCAISRRVAQRCRVSRSRAMPVGDRRSSPRACSRLAMRDLPARRAAVPGFALPRDAGRRPALRFSAVGDPRSRCAARSGAGFRAPARCRSETGAPLFRGWRCAISRRGEQRCRVSRSRAMPVGDRRSAFSWLAIRDLAARRAAVPGFALPRDAGRRPALRFVVVGDARSRGASRSGAGFRAPARCRSETGAPVPPLSRWAMRDLAARRAAVPGFALPRDAGRRPALRLFVVGDARSRGAARSGAGVSRSRAMPVGDRRSFAVSDAPSGQLGSPGARGIRKKPS